jgi:type III secretion system YscQ/HrcQ family protein
VQPYPWNALPKTSRREAELLERVSRLLDPDALERGRASLEALLALAVVVRPGALGWAPAGQLDRDLAPTLVALAGEHAAGRWALEIEPALALAAIDRVLGGEGLAPPVPGLLSPVEQGALAYLAARVGVGTVVDVFTTRGGLAAWLGDDGCACWGLEVATGSLVGRARWWLPARTLERVGHAGTGLAAASALPGGLGELPVSLRARIGRATLAGGLVARLAPGDVVIADELTWWPEERRGARETLADLRRVALVGGRGALEVEVEPGRGGWMVRGLERGPALSSVAEGDDMSTSGSQDGEELARVAELPVEVAIELGRLELRLRELAALVPGRVLSARVPVGAEVSLRAGDRTIATGELVDLDGELGVRIVRILR